MKIRLQVNAPTIKRLAIKRSPAKQREKKFNAVSLNF